MNQASKRLIVVLLNTSNFIMPETVLAITDSLMCCVLSVFCLCFFFLISDEFPQDEKALCQEMDVQGK